MIVAVMIIIFNAIAMITFMIVIIKEKTIIITGSS